MASKKSANKNAAKRTAKKSPAVDHTSMPKGGKDPKGGLTAAGRAFFANKEGAHLRPGVQGPADTPEKMLRKGSFLRRHFANPRGPMKDAKGEPTRLALSAHAWGEPVPETTDDAKKLADEGHGLLQEYHEAKDGAAEKSKAKKASQKTGSKTTPVSKTSGAPKKKPAKKSSSKKSSAKATASQK